MSLNGLELPFDVAERLGFPSSSHTGPCVGKVSKDLLPELATAIDALSERSATARALKTEYEDNTLPTILSTEDVVYLIAEGSNVLGFVRVGVRLIKVSASFVGLDAKKGGYGAFTGNLKDMSPLVMFDFFVVEGLLRRGLGKLLFDAMLLGEGCLEAGKVAYSRPSEAMLAFLTKHSGLTGGKTASTYTVFETFFDESTTSKSQPDAVAAPTADGSSAAKEIESDEPVIEEVECLHEDPLKPYRKDEDEIYTQRTKMYCFNAEQWQDAGAGNVTLLKNKFTGRVRLMFVTEAVKRVISNHFIVNRAPFCELIRHTAGNDKTWTWTAQERVLERRFALKFKSTEDANKFQEVFNGVKALSVEKAAVEYVVIRKVGVTAESRLPSKHVKLLVAGAVVKVVEVVYSEELKRVRARLVQPEGWITILSHNTGVAGDAATYVPGDAGSYAVARSDLENYTTTVSAGSNAAATV